jgi:signal transduction histidine kinase
MVELAEPGYRPSVRVPSGSDARRGDVALAGALLVLGELEAVLGTASPPWWHQGLLTLVWTLPLVWRRRWPVPVLGVVIVTGPTIELVNEQGGVTSYVLAAMLAAFTVGRERDAPTSWWGPALTVLLPWAWFTLTGGALSDFVFVALLYGGSWAVGAVLRQRALHVDELTGEAAELRRSAAEREQRAVVDERARIARELHDVVSHSISVITVQTQAVRRRLGEEHPEAEALSAIEATARQAMARRRR